MRAVISDFGGVLTTPLEPSIAGYYQRSGVSLEALGMALAAIEAAHGANPLAELESGRLSEVDFLSALAERLSERLGRPVDLSRFPEQLFAGLSPNEPFVAYMQQLRGRGYRMAICTNNVREWSQRWQALIPVREIFDVIVDSSVVGFRKPEEPIYQQVLRELGVDAEQAVFVDDLEVNCAAAAQLGMRAVWFQSTEQAMADIETALDGHG